MNKKFTKILICPAFLAGMMMFSCTEVEKIEVDHNSVPTRTRCGTTAVLLLSDGSLTGLRLGLQGVAT